MTFHRLPTLDTFRPEQYLGGSRGSLLTPYFTERPYHPMGRVRDAYQALLGRTSSQVELARMRTEWASLNLDVANLMDKLASMVGRITKRETRKAVRKLTPTPEAVAEPPDKRGDRWARKAALRRKRTGTGPVMVAPELEEGDE